MEAVTQARERREEARRRTCRRDRDDVQRRHQKTPFTKLERWEKNVKTATMMAESLATTAGRSSE